MVLLNYDLRLVIYLKLSQPDPVPSFQQRQSGSSFLILQIKDQRQDVTTHLTDQIRSRLLPKSKVKCKNSKFQINPPRPFGLQISPSSSTFCFLFFFFSSYLPYRIDPSSSFRIWYRDICPLHIGQVTLFEVSTELHRFHFWPFICSSFHHILSLRWAVEKGHGLSLWRQGRLTI